MKVSEKDVRYVAELANLELTADEQARMVKDLNAILEHVDRLSRLDTTNVPPMAQIATPHGETTRADQTSPSLPRAEALGNAPDPGLAAGEPAFFRVPKVIER
jgi:aspartyl-tRNA(Asn)/glutamyl-tRNA(Gln) amidotransferase subunit C